MYKPEGNRYFRGYGDAMDAIRHPARPVAGGRGEQLHARRVYSHSVGARCSVIDFPAHDRARPGSIKAIAGTQMY